MSILPARNRDPSLNPFAVQVLQDKGHDVSGLGPRRGGVPGTRRAPFDFVFTVCDRAANEECPPWHGQPVSGHWGLPDPVQAEGTDAERALAFQEVYGALRNRIQAFVALPFDALDQMSLQNAVDEIGRMDDEETRMTVYAVNGLGRIGKLALKPLLERGARSPGSTMRWAIRRCTRICWSSTPSTGAGTPRFPMTRKASR
jgi:hypothetical protein